MNVGRLVAGIICLALAVLNSVLPEDELLFQIGDRNMPIVPAIILGIVGIVLVATAVTGKKAKAEVVEPAGEVDEARPPSTSAWRRSAGAVS
jgi:hypothetical protein